MTDTAYEAGSGARKGTNALRNKKKAGRITNSSRNTKNGTPEQRAQLKSDIANHNLEKRVTSGGLNKAKKK